MINEKHVALARNLVEDRARYTVGLAPTMGGGNISIDIALPDVHRHRDVLQLEPPVSGKETEILRPGLTGRRRGVPEVPEKGFSDFRSHEYNSVFGR